MVEGGSTWMTCNHFYLLHQTEAECTDGRVFTAPVPLYTHSISGVHTAHGFGTTKLVDINGWSWWFNTTIFYSGSKHLTFTVKSRRKIGGLSFSNSRHLGMYTGREFWFQLRSTGWLMGSNSIEILGTPLLIVLLLATFVSKNWRTEDIIW